MELKVKSILLNLKRINIISIIEKEDVEILLGNNIMYFHIKLEQLKKILQIPYMRTKCVHAP
jgi:hypothetical protein